MQHKFWVKLTSAQCSNLLKRKLTEKSLIFPPPSENHCITVRHNLLLFAAQELRLFGKSANENKKHWKLLYLLKKILVLFCCSLKSFVIADFCSHVRLPPKRFDSTEEANETNVCCHSGEWRKIKPLSIVNSYLLGSAKTCFGISVYSGTTDCSLSSHNVLNGVATT